MVILEMEKVMKSKDNRKTSFGAVGTRIHCHILDGDVKGARAYFKQVEPTLTKTAKTLVKRMLAKVKTAK